MTTSRKSRLPRPIPPSQGGFRLVSATSASKKRAVTYLGVPAETRELKAQGARVHVTRWLAPSEGQEVVYPAGTVVATHCAGDARDGTFVEFAREVFPNGTDEQANRWAQEALA